jgi:hypothetical protein
MLSLNNKLPHRNERATKLARRTLDFMRALRQCIVQIAFTALERRCKITDAFVRACGSGWNIGIRTENSIWHVAC